MESEIYDLKKLGPNVGNKLAFKKDVKKGFLNLKGQVTN